MLALILLVLQAEDVQKSANLVAVWPLGELVATYCKGRKS
jgi:hypothetical protein